MAKKIFVIVCILALLIGCKTAAPIPTELPQKTLETKTVPTSSPSPTQEPTTNTSPAGTYPLVSTQATVEQTYPIVNTYILPPGETMGPDFKIDRPVKAGDTRVTGIGPAGVPIRLIDVNDPGKIWGETIIKADGEFEFEFSQGLPANHQIAISLGDTAGTNLNPSDFVYNPNYVDRYMLGILFDIVVTE
jgi:hypothetical protein